VSALYFIIVFVSNTITVDKENALRSENDTGDDSGIEAVEAVHNVNDQLVDADEVAQAASVDPGDDGDDGAIDGPPVTSHVDLASKIGV
jgi:hypothetical protein